MEAISNTSTSSATAAAPAVTADAANPPVSTAANIEVKPQTLSDLICSPSSAASEPPQTNLMSEIRELLAELGELLKTLLKQLLPAASAPAASSPVASEINPSASTETAVSVPALNFSEKLKLVLEPDSENRVSENELRRGVITFQLYQKSPKTAEAFVESYDKLVDDDAPADLAIEKALIGLVEDGQVSRTDANWIFSLSHRAAQLDSDTATVGKSSSGKEGFDLQGAIRCAEATLAGIQAGSIKVEQRNL